MPRLRIVVQHKLTEEAATVRIREHLSELASVHSEKISGIEESWHGNSADLSFTLLKPVRVRVSASLRVTASEFVIEGRLPLVAWPFKGRIEAVIRKHLEDCLR